MMSSPLLSILSRFFSRRKQVRATSTLAYIRNGFSSPAPAYVKLRVLKRWGGEIWIESGTHKGLTTAKLANDSEYVYSIEPSRELYEMATKKLRKFTNIELNYGTSEELFEIVLERAIKLNPNFLSFWLDGHYSGPTTFHAKSETPIASELEIIRKRLKDAKIRFSVLVDDVRGFSGPNRIIGDYPKISDLIKFVEELDLFWTIEHDIFIFTNCLELIKTNNYSA